MPEEINRLVTDQLADFLFTRSEDGDKESSSRGNCHRKDLPRRNVMIDSLVRLLPMARQARIDGLPQRYAWSRFTVRQCRRWSTLKGILESLLEVNRDLPSSFPAHPRTRKRIADSG